MKATICRVQRHIAVHTHRFCSFFCTNLQISSNLSTSSGAAGTSILSRELVVGPLPICLSCMQSAAPSASGSNREIPLRTRHQRIYLSTLCKVLKPVSQILSYCRSHLTDARQRISNQHIQHSHPSNICAQEDHSPRFSLDGSNNRSFAA